jgi:hypothetical protein
MDAALNELPLETLQTYLAEAVAARHQVLTFKKAAQVQNAGQLRTYNHGNIGELISYIADLQYAISSKPVAGQTRFSPGPIHHGLGF